MQTRGETMTQRVRLDQGTVQTDLFAGIPKCALQRVDAHRAGALTVGKEPGLRAVCPPALAQVMIQRLGQGRKPLLIALANHPKRHLVLIHAIHGQRQGLADAQAAVIHALENDPIQRYAYGGKQRLALGVFKRYGQAALRGRLDFFLNKAQSRCIVCSKKKANAKR